MRAVRRPCRNCPWRKDAPPAFWDPDHFRSIARTCRDDGMHVMLCHKTKGEHKPVCQGWVRVQGLESVGVRIAVLTGRITQAEIEDVGGPALFETFDDMLEANGIEPPPRNRQDELVARLKELQGRGRR